MEIPPNIGGPLITQNSRAPTGTMTRAMPLR